MMDQSTLDKLEYPKILKQISAYAITEKGADEIIHLSPSTDKATIEKEGKIVDEAKNILIKNVPPPIEFIPDLSNFLAQSRIDGSVLTAKQILEILKLVKNSRLIFQFLKQNDETVQLLKEQLNSLFVDKVFEHHIENIIEENGHIKDKASGKLFEIRKEIRDKQGDLLKSINKIMSSLEDKGMVREEYLTLRDGRMVIPIKSEHKRHLRGFIHSESASGQTVYIEPEQTLDLNNEIISLNFAEKRETERLLKELTQIIGKESYKITESLNTISYLDSVFARAKYSIEIIGSFPAFDNSKSFFVSEARHPVLLKKLGRSITIPLNFKLKNEKVVVITGPNAGGKTVVLKTIGLLSLLLQTGIHIPVNPDSNFHFFNKILIDIGDDQSLEDDLSTFSSHLMNIKLILDNAGKESLVLLDEIGTGTDPAEGSALATAVLTKLRDKDSLVFASTHHGSLKLIANDEKGFVNAAMEFDQENLTPTYKFKPGIPGSSYAFEIAKRIGINDELLSLAVKNIESDKHKIEKFLVEIEAKSNQLEKKLKEAENENVRLAELSGLYKNNVDKLEKEKKEILKRTKADAENYLNNINSKIESVIKELRESKAERDVIKKSKEVIKEIKEQTKKLYEPAIEIDNEISDIETGNFVNIRETATIGKVVQLDREKEKAIVEVGSVRMQVDIKDLKISQKQKEEPVEHYHNINTTGTNYRLDIRGKKPEEADFEVVRFLDDSYVSGQNRVEILHGKGTGVLKKTVKEILDSHERVKKYYFASIESGGEGITIVELK